MPSLNAALPKECVPADDPPPVTGDRLGDTVRLTSRSAVICLFLMFHVMTGPGCDSRPGIEATPSTASVAQVPDTLKRDGFIGAAACIACHPGQGAAFASTAHANALAEIDLHREPPDGEFHDPHSMRHYRIYRDGASFRQAESIRTDQGQELVLCDLPMRYVIGSGHFSRSYLVERDGFLFESPATWYAAPQAWKLSPGYEGANLGFQRPAEMRCLLCHAGRVEPIDRSPQRLSLPTLAIDCERCHGPGRAHQQKWENTATAADDPETIFHPGKVPRSVSEDVCAQCHLHVAATIEQPGRRIEDFRPGDALTDYVVHYVSASDQKNMQVVGHVEQLRLSRCYQDDERMSCLTCHSPHAPEKPSSNFFRQKCLECHTVQSCQSPREARFAEDIQDNCITCHMPRSATEIPHFAFTHHRIGIHRTQVESSQSPSPPDELIPLPGEPIPDKSQEARNRGLAYLQYSDAPGQAGSAQIYRQTAVELLRHAQANGPKDPDLDAGLARLMFAADPARTLTHATQAAVPAASPEAWTTACYTLGATNYALNRPIAALPWLEKTAMLRPTGDVFVMLHDCRLHAKDLNGALLAAQSAHDLAPDRPAYLFLLMERLRQSGRLEEADALMPRLEALRHYRQQVDQAGRRP